MMETIALPANPPRLAEPLRLPPGHRSREGAWRAAHPEALQPFAGFWVVLEGESIVAHGPSPAQLVADARKTGIPAPYVFFVEAPVENVVRISL